MIGISIGLGDAIYSVAPKDDITALESAMLCVLITVMASPAAYSSAEARLEFINRHGIWRHFDKVKKG